MMRGMFSAATGMQSQQLYIDAISNNLANVNTTGFKKTAVEFQDLLYQNIRPAGGEVSAGQVIPTGVQVGLGAKPVSASKSFSQGDLAQTENSFDIAIEGEGFFQIIQADGSTGYTRDGAFKRDANGNLVTSDGYLLTPQVTIPITATSISVGADGTVISLNADGTSTQLGQITTARFLNPSGLESSGRNLFRETVASGTATIGTPGEDAYGRLAQGFLELSNVRIVEEMVKMIIAERAYEVNSRAIRAADEMLQTANRLRG